MRSSVDMSPVSWVSSARRGVANSSRTASSSLFTDVALAALVGQDQLEVGDRGSQVGELGVEVDAGQAGEPAERHVEDVLGLDVGELERFGHEAGPGGRAVLAGPDEGDDLVDDVEGLHQAFDDVLSLARLGGPVLAAARDDIDLVLDVGLQDLEEVQRAGHPVDQGDHVHREAALELRELEQVVQHDVGVGVALQLDDEARVHARRGVVRVGDAVELAGVGQLLDAPEHRVRRDLVGQLGDHDLEAVRAATHLLDGHLRPRLDGAGPSGRRR